MIEGLSFDLWEMLGAAVVAVICGLLGFRRVSRSRSSVPQPPSGPEDKKAQERPLPESGRHREKLDEELEAVVVDPAPISDDPAANASRLDAIAAERARKRRQRDDE